MAEIPLSKYAAIYYPLTPKSTINLWAQEGYYKQKGELSGKVRKIGGRWYVTIIQDIVVDNIIENIKTLMKE